MASPLPSPIEDYALIGDCETAALVNCQGSIDWLCWPDFSSGACFAALLGTDKNGYWKICPAGDGWKTTRKYRDHTLDSRNHIRKRGGLRAPHRLHAHPRAQLRCCPHRRRRPRQHGSHHGPLPCASTTAAPSPGSPASGMAFALSLGPASPSSMPPSRSTAKTSHTAAEFTVGKGDRVWFTLTYGESHRPDPQTDQSPTTRLATPCASGNTGLRA